MPFPFEKFDARRRFRLSLNGHILDVSRKGIIGGFAIMLRLRFLGLLGAATFALSSAHSARAEPRPAETCARAMFRAVIDVGHTEKAFGATSARGLTEFAFNLKSCQAHQPGPARRRI